MPRGLAIRLGSDLLVYYIKGQPCPVPTPCSFLPHLGATPCSPRRPPTASPSRAPTPLTRVPAHAALSGDRARWRRFRRRRACEDTACGVLADTRSGPHGPHTASPSARSTQLTCVCAHAALAGESTRWRRIRLRHGHAQAARHMHMCYLVRATHSPSTAAEPGAVPSCLCFGEARASKRSPARVRLFRCVLAFVRSCISVMPGRAPCWPHTQPRSRSSSTATCSEPSACKSPTARSNGPSIHCTN